MAKLIKKAGKTSIKMSRSEWEQYGRKAGWLSKEAKWSGDAEIDHTGEWTNYTIEELKSKKDAIKKRQDARTEKGEKADPKDTEELRQINFAIRAKGGWKKGEGAAE